MAGVMASAEVAVEGIPVAEIPPALTVWRPWPTLILRYGKDVENRGWSTAYRGPLLLHAGKQVEYGVEKVWSVDGGDWVDVTPSDPGDHPQGLVGVVDVVGMCGRSFSGGGWPPCCAPWGRSEQHHWRLANPREFAEPIPCRGRQQLWHPPVEIHDAIRQALVEVSRRA